MSPNATVGPIGVTCTFLFYYHSTGGLMEILHFDWLCCQGTISNSHHVAIFAGFSFIFSPNQCFFNLHLLTLLLPFLSDQLGDTKTIRPFALKGHRSIAHEAKPNGLLTRSPFGLRVYLLNMLIYNENSKNTLSSQQACLAIAHSSGDFNDKNIHNHCLYTLKFT